MDGHSSTEALPHVYPTYIIKRLNWGNRRSDRSHPQSYRLGTIGCSTIGTSRHSYFYYTPPTPPRRLPTSGRRGPGSRCFEPNRVRVLSIGFDSSDWSLFGHSHT